MLLILSELKMLTRYWSIFLNRKHHTRVWSLDGEHHVLTTHLVVDNGATREEVLQVKKAVIALAEDMDCERVTVEIEYEDEDCRMKACE